MSWARKSNQQRISRARAFPYVTALERMTYGDDRMRLNRIVLALGTLFVLATSAEAQRAGGMAACRTDLATFCQSVEAGGGKKVRCLIENQAKLSPDCAATIQTRADARADKRVDRKADASNAAGAAPAGAAVGEPKKKRMGACRADMKALCGDVQKGGGAKIACLRDNTAKLSPDCATVLTSIPARRRDARLEQRPAAASSIPPAAPAAPAAPLAAPAAAPPAAPPKQ